MARLTARWVGMNALRGVFGLASASYRHGAPTGAVRSLGRGAREIVRPLESAIRRRTPVDKGVLKRSTSASVKYYPSRFGAGALVRVNVGWIKPPRRRKVVRRVVEGGARTARGWRRGLHIVGDEVAALGGKIERELLELVNQNYQDELARAAGLHTRLQTHRYFATGVQGGKPVDVVFSGGGLFGPLAPPTAREYFASDLGGTPFEYFSTPTVDK